MNTVGKWMLVVVAITVGREAQSQTIEHTCAAHSMQEMRENQDPEYAERIAAFDEYIIHAADDPSLRSDVIHTVPVVVHILHEGEPYGQSSNITDEQVISSITALNEDFRKLSGTNGDGDGEDIEIEFCLAVRDPDGNSTNGIIRVDASVVTDYAELGIEATGGTGAVEEDVKALSTWPRSDYMNIWVVNEIEDNNAGGGIQGYAYFPINNPVDGIVMLHNAIGTVGNLKINTDMNRTLSHEVGHYLSLYHTFHLTSDCDGESNCQTQGDKVCDTPFTVLSGSCINPACSGDQQVENYMDYTPESCRNMFTDGQKVRMRAALETERTSILSSFGCAAVTELDCGIAQIFSPAGSSCNSNVNPQVLLTNYGNTTLTTATISFGFNGSSTDFTWNGSLATGASATVDLPSMTAGNGSHEFTAASSDPNGEQDENTANDELSSSYTVAPGAFVDLLLQFDYFCAETSWKIKEGDAVIASGGPYSDYTQADQLNIQICLPEGCYDLEMHDSFGDGQSLSYGKYTLTDTDSNELAFGEDDWGALMIHEFCVAVNETVDPPNANFSTNDNTICEGESVSFSQQSTGDITSAEWTFGGGTPSSFSGLNPPAITFDDVGAHTITLDVSNSSGSDTHSTTMTVLDGIFIELDPTNPSCLGLDNGSISASVAGGSEAYTYNWSNGGSTNQISNLSGGDYSLTVTDSEGCSASNSTTLDSPIAISMDLTIQDATCNGFSDGSANCSATGGNGGIEISWSNGDNGSETNGLAPGEYTVTASDDQGCDVSENFTISEPAVLALDLQINNIACNSTSGSATAYITGGTGDYAILWNESTSGTTISNLASGNHSVTITDANGCQITESFTITETASLNVNATGTSISCFGAADGSISLEVNGGNGNYTYVWSNDSSTDSLSDLVAGEYGVTVTDDEGCSGEALITITEPSALQLVIFKTDITCFGQEDGSASASVTGGTEPYSFSWDNGQELAHIENLESGSYSLTIIDGNGCATNSTIELVEPSQLAATTEVGAPESCDGNDGGAWVNVMGGTGNYSFQWSNGSTGIEISEVPSGAYTVLVTDDNGCSATAMVDIPFDCEGDIPTTHLIDNDCGIDNMTFDDVLHCEPVESAAMYEWRFTDVVNGGFSEMFTIGDNTQMLLSQLQNIAYDITYAVEIRSIVGGQWSAFGQVCYVSMASQAHSTYLIDEDCNMESAPFESSIHAHSVTGANKYEWTFENDSLQVVLETGGTSLVLNPESGLISEVDYQVSVKAQVGDVMSADGMVCSLRIVEETLVPSIGDFDSFVNLFPNPGNGNDIHIEFSKPFEGDHVLISDVYDVHGKHINQFYLLPSDHKSELKHHFDHPLNRGMYLLRFTYGDVVVEKKWLVQ